MDSFPRTPTSAHPHTRQQPALPSERTPNPSADGSTPPAFPPAGAGPLPPRLSPSLSSKEWPEGPSRPQTDHRTLVSPPQAARLRATLHGALPPPWPRCTPVSSSVAPSLGLALRPCRDTRETVSRRPSLLQASAETSASAVTRSPTAVRNGHCRCCASLRGTDAPGTPVSTCSSVSPLE